MKKIILVLFCLLCIGLLIFYFIKKPSTSSPPLYAIGDQVVVLLRIHNMKDFQENFLQTQVWKELSTAQPFAKFETVISDLKLITDQNTELQTDINEQQIIAAGFLSGNAQMDFLITCSTHDAKNIKLNDFKPQFESGDVDITSHTYQSETVYEYTSQTENKKYAIAHVFGIFIFSNSTVLTENAILQLKSGKPVTDDLEFKMVSDRLQHEEYTQLFMKSEQFASYLNTFSGNRNTGQLNNFTNFCNWIAADVLINDEGITFSGVAALSSLNESSILHNCKEKISQPLQFEKYFPENIAFTKQLHTDELFSDILGNKKPDAELNSLKEIWCNWSENTFVFGIPETLDRNYQNNFFYIIPAKDSALALQALKPVLSDTAFQYRNHIIKEIKKPAGLFISTANISHASEKMVFTIYESNLLCSSSISFLQKWIDDLEKRKYLPVEIKNDEEAGQYSVQLNLSAAKEFIRNFVSDNIADSIEKHDDLLNKLSESYFNFAYIGANIFSVSGKIKYNEKEKNTNGLLWKFQTDAAISITPAMMQNNDASISFFVQDSLRQIYLFSGNGLQLWKKQYPEFLKGTVHHVEFFQNGEEQLLFATENGIDLIDKQGNSLEGFPLQFTSEVISELSLFQNTNTADYIFYIACANNNVYGFFKDGKPISGWNPFAFAQKPGTFCYKLQNEKKSSFAFIDKNSAIHFVSENGSVSGKFNLPENVCSMSMNIERKIRSLAFFQTIGAVILLDSEGNTEIIRLEGNPVSGVCADMNADSETEFCYLSKNELVIADRSGKIIWRNEIGKSEKLLLADNETNMPMLICTDSEQNKTTCVFVNSKKEIETFSFSETTQNPLSKFITNKNEYVFLNASGSNISAYRIK